MTALDEAFDPADAERADAEDRLRWFRSATGRNLMVNPAIARILEHHGVDMTLVDVAERAPVADIIAATVADERDPLTVEDLLAGRITHIIAKYEGRCRGCEGTIYPGDRIVPETTETVSNYAGPLRTDVSEWRHEVCPTPRGTSTCPRCFLERPCPCEDGQ